MSEILTGRDSVIFLLQYVGFVKNFKVCVLDRPLVFGVDCD